jgi:hypothetical protein
MLPDNFPLTGQGLKNWLRTDGSDLFRDTTSGAEALDLLRSMGGAIRDSDFYAIRREVLGLGRYTEILSTYDDDKLIPVAYTYQTSGLALSSEFLYRVKAYGTDPQTGNEIEKYFSVSSNNQLTPGQVKDAIGQMVVGEEGFYSINVDRFELYEALKRG